MITTRPLTLRFAVMLPFALLLLLTVGVIAIAQHNSYERMLSEVSSKLLSLNTQNVSNDLHRFLDGPFNTNLTLADSISRHQLYQPPRLTQLEDYFSAAITELYAYQQQIGTIAFGSEDKYFIGFRKNADNNLALLLKDERTGNDLHIYQGPTHNNKTSHQIRDYDPTERPWYLPFAQSRQSGWSEIYANLDERQTLTLSAVTPVLDHQDLLGVVVTDINLNHIATFLERESLPFSGITYLIDNQGRLVANSTQTPMITADNRRLLATQSTNALIATSGQYVARQPLRNDEPPTTFEFTQDNTRYFSRITSYRDSYNLQWHIVVTIPEHGLLGQLPAQQESGLVAAFIIGFLGLIIGLYILNIITQPIIDIAQASQNLTENNWDVPIRPGIKLHETAQLIAAFRSMSSRLQRSFSSLRQQILYDDLTGLLSREGLTDTTRATYHNQQGVVVLIGLKTFRHINDSLGHHRGDQLLIAIAERLQQSLPDEVLLSRIGRDEFAVFSPRFSDQAQTDHFARQLLEQFYLPFIVDGTEVMLSACAGVASGQLAESDITEWLRNSSLALSQATQQESDPVCHYQPYMIEASQEKTRLSAELQRAINHHEFEVHYQPIINLANDTISGAEALVRWRSPTRGMVPPMHFIPLAEENGMIIEIGQQILLQACEDTQKQIARGQWPQDFSLHVNLSVRQLLQADFVDQLKITLARSGLPATNLTLEITESRLVSQPLLTFDILDQLRQLGIHIAIDDFGTGYSSLAYLTQLPFDSLKIDRSFVNQMLESDDYATIIAAIITMTQNFNADIVAEGVESAEQAQRLKQLGCGFAQGYFYARPEPLSKWSTDPVNINAVSAAIEE
ncbi:diguanylate cyclase [Photobacterium lipolyticum]|uniref:Diguanylate cyclase n=2 Tax=Photobacterium lipolyticum TaxID=266810 RepID=A0A2T3MU02_9GAMM|nr:diguanylate cyclase [Photobacterium lipolyticum]